MPRLVRVASSYEVCLPHDDMRDLAAAEQALTPGAGIVSKLEGLTGVEEVVSDSALSVIYLTIAADDDAPLLHTDIARIIDGHLSLCREILRRSGQATDTYSSGPQAEGAAARAAALTREHPRLV